MKPIYYVFKVSFQSCADPGVWNERLTVRQSNECRSTPAQLAGNIAAHHLTAVESGVRVEFAGLQETDKKGAPKGDVTPCNPFTLTLERRK